MSPFKQFLGSRLMPGILFLLGVLALWIGIDNVVKGVASQGWPSTSGVVTSASIDTTYSSNSSSTSAPSTATYHPIITYDYSVNAISHSGYTVSFGGYSTTDQKEAETYLQNYPEGQKVAVFYNPGDHGESVLEPGLHDYPWIFLIPGVLFVLTGIFMARFFPKASSRT